MNESERSGDNDVAERAEERLDVPVVIAALVSVPAVFLTMAGGAAAVLGTVLNWSSLVVLAGESLLLLWLSRDRFRWIREHKWKLLVALATVPAVVLVIGPVQIVRLIMSIGAIRLLRVRRILKAGAAIRRRAELGTRRSRWVYGVVTVLAAIFVGVVLADPTSTSRRATDWIVEHLGVIPAVLGGLTLAVATFLVVRYRKHGKLASDQQAREKPQDETAAETAAVAPDVSTAPTTGPVPDEPDERERSTEPGDGAGREESDPHAGGTVGRAAPEADQPGRRHR